MTDNIDAVFCWVDGGDVQWLRKKEKYFLRELELGVYGAMNSDSRYFQFDEIYYAIHSLRKNAQWVRDIYLLTDQQAPYWLTEEKRTELGVIIVDHKDVFSGFEQALPTFNSMSIEAMINRIPGLSDMFLYFNDDIIVLKPVVPEDFFFDNGLVVRGRLRFHFKVLDRAYRNFRKIFNSAGHDKGGYVGRLAKTAPLPAIPSYVELAHAPHGIYKQDFDRVITHSFLMKNLFYKFRAKEQVSPISYILNWSRRFRTVKLNDADWRCFYSDDIKSFGVKALLEAKSMCEVKFVCFNDLSLLNEGELSELYDCLECKLK